MIELQRKFFLNLSKLIKQGFHPVLLLNGCQKRVLPVMKIISSNGDLRGDLKIKLCIRMGIQEDKICEFFYPSTREITYEKEISTSKGNGLLLASSEGLLLVDVIYPRRNNEILRATLSNLITTWGVEWYEIEIKDDMVGFVWGFTDRRYMEVKEGMSVGMINRPGGMLPVKLLYKALNGNIEYLERRGIDINYVYELAEETFNRATKILKLNSNVLPINITRMGINNMYSLFPNYSLKIQLPVPWYSEIMKEIAPLIQDPLQSELLVLVIGEKREVEDALQEAEKQGFPSFLVGKVSRI
ncbi:Hypothetical protein SSO2799 [Saccharolobus solfataricus P2]|uniref:Uncharacterized protein n=1 Tax=Saccharolobus solfataricus (strain ATCC 35092 / DSM 1617 / JCM 11322 / P2) TaxID=273057 RepID=Q97V33_SACS2|nr:hypothetical protein [Saccharolobus solfataricus]AAK42912.1 Hypothetical protein SSO2799 [Saccharolobus solfataricus P2]